MIIQDITLETSYTCGSPFHRDMYIINTVEKMMHGVEQFVETGSGLGDTLYCMGLNYPNIPCLSCEADSNRFRLTTAHVSVFPNVTLSDNISPDCLKNADSSKKTLFWLDAHGEYVNEFGKPEVFNPLREELSYVFKNFSDPIVFIDDFANPFNPKFLYDVLGGVHLTYSYIKDLIPEGYNIYFPGYTSTEYKGAPWMKGTLCGWCLICKGDPGLDFLIKG